MNITTLNVLPSHSDNQRLVLLRETDDEGVAQFVLQQESRSDHVGWFVQSRIAIDATQLAALKMTLTSNQLSELAPRAPRRSVVTDDSPSVLPMRAAIAG